MKKIVVSAGDPNGIGVEIFLKALTQTDLKDKIIFVGKKSLIEKYSKLLNIGLPEIEIEEVDADFSFNPGKIEKINGLFSAKCIEKAVKLIIKRKAQALVTLPICKENFQDSGFKFQGHTDFLKKLTNSKKVQMMFYSPSFSVILHTIHIPLKAVFTHINSKELVENIEFAYTNLRKLGIKEPKIFVCGLNPHAGENGHIGKEDFEIKDAITKLKQKGIKISGPHPADTLFAKVDKNPKNVIYAMYHDQGLIGIKTKHPQKSINITLGLPFLRLSVSHGTAFDIAGKNIANYNNLLYVLNSAKKILEGIK